MYILSICDNGDVLSAFRMVKIFINIIRIAVPIILIVSLILDYTKAMTSSDTDVLSNIFKLSLNKLVAAIVIFIMPTIVNITINIVDKNGDTYLSCFKNTDRESIDEAYRVTANDYIEYGNTSLQRADYSNAKRATNKIKNNGVKTELNNKLDKLNNYITIKEDIALLNYEYSKEKYDELKNRINDIEDEEVKNILLGYLASHGRKVVSLGIEAGVYERSDYDSEMRYVEVIPEDATTNMPIVVYLHGIWAYASFSENAPHYLITEFVKSGKAYNTEKFILIVPRVVLSQGDSRGMVTWKTSQGIEQTKKLKGLIDFIVEKYQANDRKIIITGVSLGGDGTWNMIESYPDLFSAGVPISGCAGGSAVASKFVSTPIITYHGTGALEDAYKQCVPSIYNKIKSAGGNIQLRVKNGYSHGMMQNVYKEDNGSIFDWMLEQERQ